MNNCSKMFCMISIPFYKKKVRTNLVVFFQENLLKFHGFHVRIWSQGGIRWGLVI